MKRISPATVTFGVMAVVLGLVATYVVRQAMKKPVVVAPPPARVAPPLLRQVVVARVNLPINTQISAADLTVVNVPPEHKAVELSIRSVDNGVGRITNRAIRAGQVLRDEFLLGIGESLPDLAERLPPGFRAVSISVHGANAGGKRLEHGDHVDVALTVRGTHPDLGELQTRTLLKNVLVVDARVEDPHLMRRGRNPASLGQPQYIGGDSITVAVNASDANKLITAQEMANLSVTLCSAKEDMFQDDDTTISWKELLALREIPPPPPQPVVEPKLPEPPPPPPRVRRIESFRGGGKQVLEFGEDLIREAEDNTKYVKPHVIIEPTKKEDDDSSASAPTKNPIRTAAGR